MGGQAYHQLADQILGGAGIVEGLQMIELDQQLVPNQDTSECSPASRERMISWILSSQTCSGLVRGWPCISTV